MRPFGIMMKVLVYFSILYLFSSVSFAQQNLMDSLEAVLKSANTDRQRIDILCDLSDQYLLHEPAKAKIYAEEAAKLSKNTGYARGEILALNRLGDYEFRQGNYARAIEFTSKSLQYAERLQDSILMAAAYRVLGNVNNIGLKRYDTALSYQLKAFAIYEKQKEYSKLASTCGSITWIYATTNQNLNQAHQIADLGIHLSDSLQHSQFLSYNYNSKGLLYLQESKLDSALKFIDRSIQVATRTNDRAVIAYNKRIKGTIYQLQGKYQQALEHFNIALSESRALNVREVIKNCYEGLAKCYEEMGNYPMAYKYGVLFNELKDSLLSVEITQKALITELEFEEAKREAKIAELQQANDQARNEKIVYSILFVGALLFLVTVLLFIIRNSRLRSKNNQLLREKNAKIEEQNLKLQDAINTKDKLFSIIGHDLRSPIASLKGTLSMVVRDEIKDYEFKKLASRLNGQVIGVDGMLENLLQWSRSQQEGWNHHPQPTNLQSLLSGCVNLFAESATDKGIKLVNQIPSGLMVLGDPNQLELIFRNLIHNAIKFTKAEGNIYLQAQGTKDDVVVKIIDTGIGMPESLLTKLHNADRTVSKNGTLGERGTGLGLPLCFEMVNQNGGRLEVHSTEGEGSTFCVYLKAVSAPDLLKAGA